MDKFIKQIGRKAGEMLLRGFKFDAKIVKQRSSDKGFHTKYDFNVEKFLIKEIKKKYPDHSILGEEFGEDKKDSEYFWILDPLDGTNNFVNHNPFFSVSIALLKNNQPILAYIYAPFLKEEYFAQKGKGAFRNGKKTIVSSEKKLTSSYLYYCEGGERSLEGKKRVGKIINNLYPKLRGIRKLGAASIECGWVASGRIEGYFSTKIPAWDVAAGALLIQEAGGKVTNFQGKPWQPIQEDFVASNGKIYRKLVQQLKNL
jgi:myo-inositol-1(or 4)-monophosphatase